MRPFCNCFFGDVAFSDYYYIITVFLYYHRFSLIRKMENTSCVSPFRMAFFYLVTTGYAVLYGDFLHYLSM